MYFNRPTLRWQFQISDVNLSTRQLSSFHLQGLMRSTQQPSTHVVIANSKYQSNAKIFPAVTFAPLLKRCSILGILFTHLTFSGLFWKENSAKGIFLEASIFAEFFQYRFSWHSLPLTIAWLNKGSNHFHDAFNFMAV